MKKTISVLLAIIMLFAGAVIPVSADDQPSPEPTWQDYIESVTPVSDEPYLKLELTPTGYIFTDCYIPMKYDITFKDGRTERVQIPRKVYYDLFFDGYYIGHLFDVDAGDETLTLYACIYFDRDNGTCFFELGQMITVPEEYEGETYDYYYFYKISAEQCRAEIDDSSFIARILYPVYAFFENIVLFFEDLIYNLDL